MDLELVERLATLPLAGLLFLALFFQHRQSEKRIARLEAQLEASEAKREAEHQARLQDQHGNSKALLEMSAQVHKAVDVLEQQLEANEQQAQRRR